jgi:NADH-quinone oxidoreductase subunit N
MNLSLISLEIAVVGLGLGLLLLDLWTPREQKRNLGYIAALALAILLIGSFFIDASSVRFMFNEMLVLDYPALFFKRVFLIAAILVLVISVEFADRIEAGITEYYAFIIFALAGMLFAASANDLILVFVSLELMTLTFYVLVSYRRGLLSSLEAGVKYLILGALSTAFLVFGIAFIYGTTTLTNFGELSAMGAMAGSPLFLLGVLLVLVALAFKIAAFPFHIWAPDVYQGAPTPTTAFLAIGSKAAGMVLILRLLLGAVPEVTVQWSQMLMVMTALTILYGNLCALPQRNLKRLMGYSSIAHAGYLLLGVTALTHAGATAVLYYVAGYLFTVLAAFMVITLAARDSEDIGSLAGLNRRSPLLAAAMTFSMVSLAGIPPLAGFFGKFLLLRAVIEQGAANPAYFWLAGVAIIGVVISIYYYFGIIRVIYWSEKPVDGALIVVAAPARWALYACLGGMIFLGVYPGPMVDVAARAAAVLGW